MHALRISASLSRRLISSTRPCTSLCSPPRIWATPARNYLWGKKKSPAPSLEVLKEIQALSLTDRPGAVNKLKQVLEDNPEHQTTVHLLVELLLLEKRQDEALAVVDKAMESQPNDLSYWTIRGGILQQQGKLYVI